MRIKTEGVDQLGQCRFLCRGHACMNLGVFVPAKEAKSATLRLKVGQHIGLGVKGIWGECIRGQGLHGCLSGRSDWTLG